MLFLPSLKRLVKRLHQDVVSFRQKTTERPFPDFAFQRQVVNDAKSGSAHGMRNELAAS
jgi:hypothetical protein